MKKTGKIDPKKEESSQGMEDNNGASLEYFIDLGGHCFLCLRGVSLETGNGVEKEGENELDCQIIIISFQDLFLYLDMELGEVLAVPKRRLKKLSKMELIVECCGDCHGKMKRFAEVYFRPEKIEEAQECLREIHEKMAEGVGRLQNLRRLFESTTKSRPRAKSKIVERFWIETLNNCKKRLNLKDLLPEVKVKKEVVVPTIRRSLRSSGPPPTPSALPSKASKKRGSSKGKNRPQKYRTQVQKLSVPSTSTFRAKDSKRVSRRPEYYSVEIRNNPNKRRRPKKAKKMNKKVKLDIKLESVLTPPNDAGFTAEPELTPTEISCPAVDFSPVQDEKENEPPRFSPDITLWKTSSLQYEIVDDFSDSEISVVDLTDD